MVARLLNPNWGVTFEDGSSLREGQVPFWDEVPRDKRILTAWVMCGARRIDFSGFDKIYIARHCVISIAGDNHSGYVVVEFKNGIFKETYTRGGVLDIYEVPAVSASEMTFRQGVKCH